jgi:hypothetical protein
MSSILDFRGLYFCVAYLKQFKKNFYYILTRLLEGHREWPSSYDWIYRIRGEHANHYATDAVPFEYEASVESGGGKI